VAIASLALGAGANTAIFQLLDAIRLRTLPVAAPQELAEVRIGDMTHARGNWLRDVALTNPLWEKIRERQQPFSGIFAWADDSFNIAPSGESAMPRDYGSAATSSACWAGRPRWGGSSPPPTTAAGAGLVRAR
jgi:hypothetical protein